MGEAGTTDFNLGKFHTDNEMKPVLAKSPPCEKSKELIDNNPTKNDRMWDRKL